MSLLTEIQKDLFNYIIEKLSNEKYCSFECNIGFGMKSIIISTIQYLNLSPLIVCSKQVDILEFKNLLDKYKIPSDNYTFVMNRLFKENNIYPNELIVFFCVNSDYTNKNKLIIKCKYGINSFLENKQLETIKPKYHFVEGIFIESIKNNRGLVDILKTNLELSNNQERNGKIRIWLIL